MADGPVVVIRCMDPRFQDEWASLMREELGKHYAISCVGGVRSLLTPSGKRFLVEQLKEFKRIFGDEAFNRCHFVLVAHGECKAYRGYKRRPEEVQYGHLKKATEELRGAIKKLGHGSTGDPLVYLKHLSFRDLSHELVNPSLIDLS